MSDSRAIRQHFDDFGTDVRYGARQLVRNPLVTAVCVITLALGIGANAAIFSIVYAVLLRPLPFKDSDRLVLVSEYRPGNVATTGSPFVRYDSRAAQNHVFEETGAYWDVTGGNGIVFGGSGSVARLQASIVTNSLFSILGVRPERGRTFSPSEEAPGGAKVFLVSHAVWRGALGGEPSAIGRTFRIDGEPYTLIGVLPPEFAFPGRCDMWMPVGVLGTSLNRDRLSHQFWMIGRLRRAATLEQARVELNRLQDQLAQAYPASDANWRVAVAPLLEHLVGNVRTPLWVLSGAVGFVLLIAGSNVVNLLLARAIAREKEFAVRSALGAVRWRLVRQSLTESLLMALAGAGLAVVLAVIGLRGIGALSAGTIPRFEEPHLNGTVLAVGAALALVTTLLVGIAPGLQVSRPPHGRATTRLRNGLVVAEVALTLLLLSGAGLMIRSFAQLRNVDPGFDPRRLTTVKIALPETLYPHVEQRQAFLHLLLQELNATPGITSASATDRLPLSGESNWGSVNIVGRPMLDAAHAPVVEGRAVSATYFRTLGIRLLRGRAFTEADISQHRHVTVINDVMARQFWPGADPIGQRVVDVYHQDDTSEIIGVVANVKDFALDAESAPDMYRPYTWWTEMNLMLRGGLDQTALVGAVRRDVAALDREVPVYEVTTMRQLVDHSVGRQRFELFALAFFALISLALAAVGIYGVLAFAVSRRTREMGIRIALGAPARRVLTLIISQGMKLVLVGIGLGVVGSLGLTRLMSHLLFHVSPADPSILVTVGAIVGLIGALACVIPARRATRVDPIVALRREP